MMLPLLLASRSLISRFTTSLTASTSVSAAVTAGINVQTRRTLFTTPRLALAAAATPATRPASAKAKPGRPKKSLTPRSASTATTTKTGRTVKAGRKKPTKKTASKKKVKKAAAKKAPKKPKIRFTRETKPPKAAPNAYLLFNADLLRGKEIKRGDISQHAATVSKTWQEFTLAQKQPYYDRAEQLAEEQRKKKEEYFRTVDRSFLRALNSHRASRGKPKIHRRALPEEKQPPTAYMRYFRAFSRTPEGRAILDGGTQNGVRPAVLFAKACGEHWRNMSDTDKEEYARVAREETEAWKAIHRAKSE